MKQVIKPMLKGYLCRNIHYTSYCPGDRISSGLLTYLVSNNPTINPQRLQVLQLGVFLFRNMKWYFFPQTGCLLQPIGGSKNEMTLICVLICNLNSHHQLIIYADAVQEPKKKLCLWRKSFQGHYISEKKNSGSI